MRREEQPGYNPEYRERGPEKSRAVERTQRVLNTLKHRSPNKAAEVAELDNWLREASERVHGTNEAVLDLETVQREAEFDIGDGFKSQEDDEWKWPGTVHEAAPMTKEQMRVLLATTLPASLIPFVSNHFEFRFDNKGTPPREPSIEITDPGPPTVPGDPGGEHKTKIKITLNRDSFYTQGRPEGMSERERERRQSEKIVGFIDPSRITFMIGRVVADSIPPPPEWDKIGPTLPKTTNISGSSYPLQEAWRDFIGLAIVSPDIARSQSLDAFNYYLEIIDRFNQETYDEVAIAQLRKSLDDHPGSRPIPQQSNFKVTLDLRTEQEKREDNRESLSDDIRWYDEAFKKANKLLRFIPGVDWQLTYEQPEDPERAYQLANDSSEIKKILERTRQVDRDKIFGDILKRSNYDDIENRTKARRYLLATSQSEDWHEWREYAWLHKFSETFRETGGEQISKEDYEDLRAIHNASAQAKRHGTDMMQYKQEIGDDGYGRVVYRYVRKEREEWIHEIAEKIIEKSDDQINKSGISTFDILFDAGGDWIDYDAKFDNSKDGMSVTYGHLDNLLGKELSDLVLNKYLVPWKVEKITPDVKLMVERLYNYYKAKKGKVDKAFPARALQAISYYGTTLNQPPTARVKNLEPVIRQLSANPDTEQVARCDTELTTIQGMILSSIEWDAEAMALDATHQAGGPTLTEDTIRALAKVLEKGTFSIPIILEKLEPTIVTTFPTQTDQQDQERDNLLTFLKLEKTQENLRLLERVVNYKKRLEPKQLATIEEIFDEVKKDPNVLLGASDVLDKKDLDLLEKHAIISSIKDQEKNLQLTTELTARAKTEALIPKAMHVDLGTDATNLITKTVAELAWIGWIEKVGYSIGKVPTPAERDKLILTAATALSKTKPGVSPTKTKIDSSEKKIRAAISEVEDEVAGEHAGNVRNAIIEAEQKTVAKVCYDIMVKALTGGIKNTDSLEYYLKRPDPGDPAHSLGTPPSGTDTYYARYDDWLKGPGKLFKPTGTYDPAKDGARTALQRLQLSLQDAVLHMDKGDIRGGLERKDEILNSLNDALNFVLKKLEPPKED